MLGSKGVLVSKVVGRSLSLMHNDTSLMRRPYSLTAQWPGTIPFGDFTYKTGVDRDPCCYAQI